MRRLISAFSVAAVLVAVLGIAATATAANSAQVVKVPFTVSPDAKAAIGGTFANVWIGAIISPFFVGMVADRYFSAQKVLGVLNLINAGVLYWISQCNDVAQFKTGILIWSILYGKRIHSPEGIDVYSPDTHSASIFSVLNSCMPEWPSSYFR